MLHCNIDLSRLMVHFHQEEDSWRKRVICDVRMPRPQDQAGPSHGDHSNNYVIREQPRFEKGQQNSAKANPHRGSTPKVRTPESKKGNGGEMQRPTKNGAKCGRSHS